MLMEGLVIAFLFKKFFLTEHYGQAAWRGGPNWLEEWGGGV